MTSQGWFVIREYCACGASMTGSGSGKLEAFNEISNVFWQIHSGEGHYPTDAKTAAAARRREARKVREVDQ